MCIYKKYTNIMQFINMLYLYVVENNVLIKQDFGNL